MIEKMFRNKSRTGMIQAAGSIGILANVLFAAVKLVIGLASNSFAILSDAVNNLSDVLSAIITLAGLKLSQKPRDRKHPLGHGRLEYISSMIIAAIILFAGFEFLKTSFRRILHPEAVEFTTMQFVILGITLAGKWMLSRLHVRVGKLTDSLALQASGADAATDVAASAFTIITAVIAKFTRLNLDGTAGLLLAAFILYTGMVQMRETISNLLGERGDRALVDAIQEELKQYQQILGSYDFIIHSYGPATKIGSVNLEFADILTVREAYEVMSKAQREILHKHHVYLTFGVYAVNTYDTEVRQMQDNIREILCGIPYILSFHAFHVDQAMQVVRLDIVIDFTVKDSAVMRSEIQERILQACPGYTVELAVDLDYA